MNIQKYNDFFEKYTNNYICNVTSQSDFIHLTRKKDHCYRVVKNALRIGKSLNLNEQDLFLLNIIALFHDLGRFPQFKKYHTYDDLKSTNHALLSIRELNNTNILSSFSRKDICLIKNSILYHNVKELPKHANARELLFFTILRDADKLDMYKNIVDIIPNLPKEEQSIYYHNKAGTIISDNVYNKIMNRELISDNEIQTQLDKQVRSLGFISSDMFYKESFKIILENNYVDRIYSLLPKTEKITNICNFVKNIAFEKAS